MKWIIQDNLYNEYGYQKFIKALDRLNCDYTIVKPVPFTNIVVPEDFDSTTMNIDEAADPVPDNTGPIMAMGATSLTRIARARGWSPGTFHNDDHHFDKWNENFGEENMLNPKSESKVGLVKEFFGYTPDRDVFVRPTEDSKAISGTVMGKYEFADWVQQISTIKKEGNLTPLHQDTEIVISPTKKIYSECRLFIVDGVVVTQSMYKVGNRVIGNSDVNECFIEFAQSMANKWQPADGFVIDVADTPNGLKVIEVNCLNSSGFYECDPLQIVNAIEEMYK